MQNGIQMEASLHTPPSPSYKDAEQHTPSSAPLTEAHKQQHVSEAQVLKLKIITIIILVIIRPSKIFWQDVDLIFGFCNCEQTFKKKTTNKLVFVLDFVFGCFLLSKSSVFDFSTNLDRKTGHRLRVSSQYFACCRPLVVHLAHCSGFIARVL